MTFGLQHATVRFGDTVALDDVTVAVPAGTVVAIVGGDGAGKSTLLRAIVGEVALAAGTVDVPADREIGYLTASAGSWAALSVNQNLDFVGGIYGLHGEALATRRTELLDRSALTRAEDRLASQLSGGMRRKLGFDMAIMSDPTLLVLDEPSTGVDPVSRIDLWRLVTEAAASGAAVIMSTTYLDEAERATYLVVLDRGQILTAGSYDEVRASFRGSVTRAECAVRPEWSWRRGRERHEYWPDSDAPPDATTVDPDLEDIVIALSLVRRQAEVEPEADHG
jgi:ABC-2 type transport system ATP-binding protein